MSGITFLKIFKLLHFSVYMDIHLALPNYEALQEKEGKIKTQTRLSNILSHLSH